jgi:hypothetical protein
MFLARNILKMRKTFRKMKKMKMVRIKVQNSVNSTLRKIAKSSLSRFTEESTARKVSTHSPSKTTFATFPSGLSSGNGLTDLSFSLLLWIPYFLVALTMFGILKTTKLGSHGSIGTLMHRSQLLPSSFLLRQPSRYCRWDSFLRRDAIWETVGTGLISLLLSQLSYKTYQEWVTCQLFVPLGCSGH